MKDRSLLTVNTTGPDEVTVTIDEPVPTPEEIEIFKTRPLPKGLRGIDNCGAGSNEYRFNNPLAIWRSFPVTYAFDSSIPSSLKDGINKSFDVINQLKAGFFKLVNLGSEKIKVRMSSIDSSGGTLARANWSYSTTTLTLSKASITFDTNEKWAWLSQESCGTHGSTYDIGNTAVHEILHTVCLGHAPSDPLQTMYAVTGPGKTLGRTLGNGDKLGVMKAYNITEPVPVPTPVPPIPEPTPEPTPEPIPVQITKPKITTIDGATYLNLAYENSEGEFIPIKTLTDTHSLPFDGLHAKIITISGLKYIYLYYYRAANVFTTLGRIPLQ